MEQIAQFCQSDSQLLLATNYKIIDLSNEAERDAATAWWLEMTHAGGEGMVIKPMDFIDYQGNKLVQPAVKCRGSDRS
jgi:protein phosphatase